MSAPPDDEPLGRSHLQAPSRWQRLRIEVRRQDVVAIVVAGVAALLLGVAIGRATAPGIDQTGRMDLETVITPLSLDADTLWTTGTDGRPGVAEGLFALRQEGDPSVVLEHADGWLDAYDVLLRRMVGVEVAPPIRAVQRQFVHAVAVARDAVEVLVAAATTDDPALRRELSSEVIRLRTRAEHLNQSARASLADLGETPGSGVSVPAELPTLDSLR